MYENKGMTNIFGRKEEEMNKRMEETE